MITKVQAEIVFLRFTLGFSYLMELPGEDFYATDTWTTNGLSAAKHHYLHQDGEAFTDEEILLIVKEAKKFNNKIRNRLHKLESTLDHQLTTQGERG